jgi:hypothetical protein
MLLQQLRLSDVESLDYLCLMTWKTMCNESVIAITEFVHKIQGKHTGQNFKRVFTFKTQTMLWLRNLVFVNEFNLLRSAHNPKFGHFKIIIHTPSIIRNLVWLITRQVQTSTFYFSGVYMFTLQNKYLVNVTACDCEFS